MNRLNYFVRACLLVLMFGCGSAMADENRGVVKYIWPLTANGGFGIELDTDYFTNNGCLFGLGTVDVDNSGVELSRVLLSMANTSLATGVPVTVLTLGSDCSVVTIILGL